MGGGWSEGLSGAQERQECQIILGVLRLQSDQWSRCVWRRDLGSCPYTFEEIETYASQQEVGSISGVWTLILGLIQCAVHFAGPRLSLPWEKRAAWLSPGALREISASSCFPSVLQIPRSLYARGGILPTWAEAPPWQACTLPRPYTPCTRKQVWGWFHTYYVFIFMWIRKYL